MRVYVEVHVCLQEDLYMLLRRFHAEVYGTCMYLCLRRGLFVLRKIYMYRCVYEEVVDVDMRAYPTIIRVLTLVMDGQSQQLWLKPPKASWDLCVAHSRGRCLMQLLPFPCVGQHTRGHGPLSPLNHDHAVGSVQLELLCSASI